MTAYDLRRASTSKLEASRNIRLSWWLHWRELADFILPRRYRWLILANQMRRGSPINGNIVDSTGTLAARVLAAGMMAGVTNPTRPWFKLKIEGFDSDMQVAAWLYECERRMGRVFQESNFYTAMAVMHFDLVVFGTGPVIINEDFENVINCFNPCAGEYFLATNNKFQINTFMREFTMTYTQMIDEFDEDNVADDVKAFQRGGGAMAGVGLTEKVICHIIEPHKDNYDLVPKLFPFREVYWDPSAPDMQILRARGFHEWPGMMPRWDVTGNDPYGRSPGMDALGDVKQLQQETRRKAQAIDKMVNPPMIADIQLKNQPASTIPGGWTYVSGLDNSRVGARPIYTVNPQIGELKQDIADIQNRIKVIFQNDLFTGITDLQTVRTATEIDARREEKLVLLGPVLERIIGEGLGKAIDRVWGIMMRGQLLPPPPPQVRGNVYVGVDYVSMLSLAQRGLATAGIEKLWGFAGNLAGLRPDVLDNLNPDETIDEYADALGVSAKLLVDPRQVAQVRAQREQKQQAADALAAGQQLAQGAQTLSQTDVGGGKNALQLALGNENV